MSPNRLFFPLLFIIAPAFAGGADQVSQWVKRPWEIRYLLFVASENSFKVRIRFAQKSNANPYVHGREFSFRDGDALLRPHKVPGAQSLAAAQIGFSADGSINEGSSTPPGWSAKLNIFNKIVLIQRTSDTPTPYFLADWNQGIPGDTTFSPAVCAGWDDERYLDDWYPNLFMGDFGCREWTAQLYDADRPYIDITSYSPQGAFIGSLVGWSRFTDPAKPVIGLQGSTWLCVHECPRGERPGVIKDIAAWTKKHGYPLPERPAKQPQYPNSDFKDDLNELAE